MPQTLLLADDSITIQRVIELTFADEDIRVVAVGDGDRAIATLDEAAPDIVLADVDMPGRDGYEVARYVRATPRLAHIPVLLLSGAFEPVDLKKANEVGCQGILAKPFEPQLVIQRVKSLLAHPARRSPAALEALEPRETPRPERRPPEAVESYFKELDQAFERLGGHDLPRTPPPAPVPPAPVPPAAAAPLAAAFAALLEAERTQAPPVLAGWPSEAPPARLPDDVIEEIVQRVLTRLSDRVVRETVGPVVLDVAERLVREELDRIRASIR